MGATAKKGIRPVRAKAPASKKGADQTKTVSAERVAGKPANARGKATEMVHIRVSETLKEDATKTLAEIGITLPEAVRLFMHRVVIEKALPLRLDVPNAKTRAAMEEGRLLGGKFATAQELIDDLEKGDEH
jgi:DNA-damage-inducible protein J